MKMSEKKIKNFLVSLKMAFAFISFDLLTLKL